MSNKKQTSIEWLYEQIWIVPLPKLPEVLEQAKELHRQEIMDAYRFPNTLSDISSEQYYKDTYETDN